MLHNGRSKSLNTSGIFFLLTASLHWETEGVFGSFFSWLVGMWEVFFFFHLFHCAKDVSIILLEAPYTSQATQSAREFISVKNSKICKSKRQFPPGSGTMGKHQAKRNIEKPSFYPSYRRFKTTQKQRKLSTDSNHIFKYLLIQVVCILKDRQTEKAHHSMYC